MIQCPAFSYYQKFRWVIKVVSKIIGPYPDNGTFRWIDPMKVVSKIVGPNYVVHKLASYPEVQKRALSLLTVSQ